MKSIHLERSRFRTNVVGSPVPLVNFGFSLALCRITLLLIMLQQNLLQSVSILGATVEVRGFEMRKTLLAIVALVALGSAVPDAASARGGFHGGGFHGGGFQGGGFHGSGFRGYGGGYRGGFGGFRGRGYGYGALGLGVGLGLGSYYGGYYGSPYYAGYYGGDCYLVQRRIWTSYGWRLRPVRVCG